MQKAWCVPHGEGSSRVISFASSTKPCQSSSEIQNVSILVELAIKNCFPGMKFVSLLSKNSSGMKSVHLFLFFQLILRLCEKEKKKKMEKKIYIYIYVFVFGQ